MASEFSNNAKSRAWKSYVDKPTSKAELSRVFLGNDPQTAFEKVKSGLQKELDATKKKTTKPLLLKAAKISLKK